MIGVAINIINALRIKLKRKPNSSPIRSRITRITTRMVKSYAMKTPFARHFWFTRRETK